MKELDSKFIEYLGDMGKSFGLDDLPLKVFAVLFIEPDEISLEEIAKKTGYSLASISMTTKMLESMRAIKRIRKPGSKKVFFYMDKDMVRWNLIKLDLAKNSIIKPAKQQLPGLIKEYRQKAKTDKDKKKVEIIDNYYGQILLFERLLEKWKKDLMGLMNKK